MYYAPEGLSVFSRVPAGRAGNDDVKCEVFLTIRASLLRLIDQLNLSTHVVALTSSRCLFRSTEASRSEN